jgi:hypothetical protein
MESGGPQITRATLTPVVRRALGSTDLELDAWQAQTLGTTMSGSGLYRVHGTASDQGRPAPWSLVLKVCRDPGGAQHADPRSKSYWKREALAYGAGLLAQLPLGVRAPRCFGVDEQPEGGAWLWIEELADAYGVPWPLARYGLAARHAGQLNGAYLADRPLPAVPWLSAGGARSDVEWLGAFIERLPEFADHPLVRHQWPDAGTADRIARLWRERENFFAVLVRLPQALCHLDLYRGNLFAVRDPQGRDETVAVDWAFLGTAAVGEELAPLVCASVAFGDADPERVRELGALAFDGYVAGLRDAGWTGDARLARLGYAAGTIRYGVAAIALFAVLHPEVAARAERTWGRPIEDIVERFGAVQRYTLDLADEVRQLMPSL